MAEFRVGELASAAGTTTRNVRAYQDRGLLPPPVRKGRVVVYDDAHLARLRLIVGLLGRGYTLAQIEEMIETWQDGRDLTDLMGLEDALSQPWTDETPQQLSLAEARREFGAMLTPANLKRMLALGAVVRRRAHFEVLSPRLVQAGRELLAAGVSGEQVLRVAEGLVEHTDALAALFLDTIRRELVDARGPDWVPEGAELAELTDVVNRLRPLAQSAVSASLALSMSRAFPEFLEEVAAHLRPS
ncbi:MerR family transcriptional regulator [Actinokineospora sp. HUAS TT18]|uniref:MerR family transcriptional regulator n=1 Tax=Actinokineospora sp. HUAS TT18 TaxID=3447451 RepID=UPI003F520F44